MLFSPHVVALNQNWLIFSTRAEGFFWTSIPSWQLTGAVLIVDALATVFCLFGWFVGPWTDIVTTVKVVSFSSFETCSFPLFLKLLVRFNSTPPLLQWIYALFVFFILSGVFVITQKPWFDRLMHGRLRETKKKHNEDLLMQVARLSAAHEKTT